MPTLAQAASTSCLNDYMRNHIAIRPHVHAYAGLLQPTKLCSNPRALQTKVYTPRGTLVGSNTRRLLIRFLPHSFASPQPLLIPIKLESQIVSNSWRCFYFLLLFPSLCLLTVYLVHLIFSCLPPKFSADPSPVDSSPMLKGKTENCVYRRTSTSAIKLLRTRSALRTIGMSVGKTQVR